MCIRDSLKIAYLSQMHGEVFNEKETVLKNFEDAGFETEAEIVRYLKTYGFEEELVYNKVENLSGGEKNLLQLAKISRMDADFLLLDEPTSHLDTYSQLADVYKRQEYRIHTLKASNIRMDRFEKSVLRRKIIHMGLTHTAHHAVDF